MNDKESIASSVRPFPAKVSAPQEGSLEDGDLTDMLGELRVVLPTAQLLTAFLITVPFMPGFTDVAEVERYVFLATFILSVTGLVLLSAPAVQHRLVRPLMDRVKYRGCSGCGLVAHLVLVAAAGNVAGQAGVSVERSGTRHGRLLVQEASAHVLVYIIYIVDI